MISVNAIQSNQTMKGLYWLLIRILDKKLNKYTTSFIEKLLPWKV